MSVMNTATYQNLWGGGGGGFINLRVRPRVNIGLTLHF